MAKKRKRKKIRADEVIERGPIRIARIGNQVVWESNWPEGAFEEAQKRLIDRLPLVIQEIDSLVEKIVASVRSHSAERILLRAWWDMAAEHLKVVSEIDVGADEANSLRMVDYLQSLAASVEPDINVEGEFSDHEWGELRGTLEQLFNKLNTEYQVCRTANDRANDPNFNPDFEEFKFKAQLYWVNVRGARYQVHQAAYMSDMFLHHSIVLQELFGISAEQFVAEIMKIWHALTFGLGEAMEELQKFQEATVAALETKVAANSSLEDSDPAELMSKIIEENSWGDWRDSVLGRAFGTALFDVEKNTELPDNLLHELTWKQGEETEFLADGSLKGWPLRVWPIFRRPFIKLGERYYCFDLYSLFDHLYRGMQRIILKREPAYRETWNSIQQQLSEELPMKYFTKILAGAETYQSVYYRWHTADGSAKEWCEADRLIVYEDHLFIIESRGGAFTYTSPATDFTAYVDSLRNLVLKPANQGRRFLQYLRSEDVISIYDKDHQKIGELRAADFRATTICAVTIDAFTELAAQVQHLRKLGVDVGDEPVWAVSVDDLRVYADIFENPLIFLHFVEQRMLAFKSNVIQSDDELDHLGLYLKHNNYSMYAQEMRDASGAKIGFHGYRVEVDKFFSARLHDASAPCPLRQTMHYRIAEMIDLLSRSKEEGRVEISSSILDMADDVRDQISEAIEMELASQPASRRPKPFSTHGDARFTVFCYVEGCVARSASAASDHAKSVMSLHDDLSRFLLELNYTQAGKLSAINWRKFLVSEISSADRARLQSNVEMLREQRLKNARLAGKVGRNETCPCGSGKKYKRCCIRT